MRIVAQAHSAVRPRVRKHFSHVAPAADQIDRLIDLGVDPEPLASLPKPAPERRKPLLERLSVYSGGGIRTRDLRVMSPTSYLAAPPRVASVETSKGFPSVNPGQGGCRAEERATEASQPAWHAAAMAPARVAVVDLGTNSTRLLVADVRTATSTSSSGGRRSPASGRASTRPAGWPTTRSSGSSTRLPTTTSESTSSAPTVGRRRDERSARRGQRRAVPSTPSASASASTRASSPARRRRG